ncbi:hypothetical protein HMPREF2128_02765 [Pseudoglutamicibacter albus DNF00011]|uniref:Core-binding (CB) domain-containing protein n=2 Tax=Micrococcales TaxID=85006 RepID=A0A095YFR3_9MICC|nr:hypothetical protein HMPREF2128_02765 [Pseudoglutamicibacter albus DNF00011]
MPVVEVTPKIIMDWYDRLHEDKGDGVSHDVFSMVRTMFNYAIGKARGLPYDFDRVIERSPFEGAGDETPHPREGS